MIITWAWLANKLHIRELLFTVHERERERTHWHSYNNNSNYTRRFWLPSRRCFPICVCVWVFFCALSSLSLALKGKNYTKRKMCVDWSQLPFAAADCRLFILLLWTTSAKCWRVKCETHTQITHTLSTLTHTHTPRTCTFDSCSLQFICTPKCNSSNNNMQWERSNNNNNNSTITMARLNELSEARA